MTAKFYDSDYTQKLRFASINYLHEHATKLYEKSWIHRYYNESSWVYGVTEEEITSFKALYESTLDELRKQTQIEDMPLTYEKINAVFLSFPKFDAQQFLSSNHGTSVLRGLIAYIVFPYGFYLIYKNIKKTRHFRLLLSNILDHSKTIINIIKTNNIEDWLEQQRERQ